MGTGIFKLVHSSTAAHPLGFKWNSKGELVADQIKELHDMTAEDFRIAEEVQTAESEWDILFKTQAVDFLCAEHGSGCRNSAPSDAQQQLHGSNAWRRWHSEENPFCQAETHR